MKCLHCSRTNGDRGCQPEYRRAMNLVDARTRRGIVSAVKRQARAK